MIFTDANGKQWEFTGEYRKPRPGDYALSDVGEVEEATCSWPEQRAIVHPVRKEHIFGGIVWEEVEQRQVKFGEWVRRTDGVCYVYDASDVSRGAVMIVRPIRVVQ